jgi:hypothetical protein
VEPKGPRPVRGSLQEGLGLLGSVGLGVSAQQQRSCVIRSCARAEVRWRNEATSNEQRAARARSPAGFLLLWSMQYAPQAPPAAVSHMS